jgi:hypothetical protein
LEAGFSLPKFVKNFAKILLGVFNFFLEKLRMGSRFEK